jgi:hypothetical protein
METFVVRPRVLLTLVFAGLFARGAVVFAVESPPGDPVTADALFREGRLLILAGDYPHACPKFAESLRLDHAPGTLLNLADCEEHISRVATAWEYFRELSRELPSTDERQSFAAQRAAALEPRLSRLTVRASTSFPSGITVWRDEVELERASLDVALIVDPGVHTVLVSKGDSVLYRVEVEVGDGQSRLVMAEPSHDGEKGPARSGLRTAAWIAGGLAVTAFATGTGFGISALSNSSAADAHCTGGVCTNAASAGSYDEARSQARVADVAFGIGLAAAVTAGGLFIASLRSGEQPNSSARLVSLALGRVTW